MLEVAYQETLCTRKRNGLLIIKRSDRLIDCFTVNVQFSG